MLTIYRRPVLRQLISPYRGPSERRSKGTLEFVEPLRHKSQFWHNMWLECGRSKTGVVADVMRRTRTAFHYAIRCIKQNADTITNERFAEAVVNNKSLDMRAEIKRIRGCMAYHTNVVDGRDTPAQIFVFC